MQGRFQLVTRRRQVLKKFDLPVKMNEECFVLGVGEHLVAVAFDKGFVHEPTSFDKASLFFRSNWPLGAPFVVFAIMFYLWWTQGRDPRLGIQPTAYCNRKLRMPCATSPRSVIAMLS